MRIRRLLAMKWLFLPCAGLLLLLGCGREPRPLPEAAPVYREVTVEAGIDFTHFNGGVGEYHYPEIMGGGVCLFDADGDEDLDLYLVSGTAITGAAPAERPHNVLYRNDGDGRFVDATETAGVGDETYGQGCCAADYDADGDVDLYLTNWGGNVFYENVGGGVFEDSTGRTGTGDDRWGQGCSFVDVDLDGDLDLYAQNYLEYDPGLNEECSGLTGLRDYCSPAVYEAQSDVYYSNNGDGTFTDRTLEAGLYADGGKGMGILWFDPDRDGDQDLYVANDGTQNFLFVNRGDGTFEDESLLAGVAFDASGTAEASMGIDAGDFDLDGDLDMVVPCLSGETFTLYVNDDGRFFTDGSGAAGLNPLTTRVTGFSPAFLDFDNDGDLDLFATTGRVTANPDVVHVPGTDFLERYGYPEVLFSNDGQGRFERVLGAGPYFRETTVARGAAIGDYDDDGGIDIALVHLGGRAVLLRNEMPDRGNWIGVSLAGNPPNREGYGAVVRCIAGGKTQIRLIRDGGGYLSKNDSRAHFGLGQVERVERIEVQWPSGEITKVEAPAPGRYIEVREGE